MYVQQVNKHTLAKGKGNVTTYCLIHSALRSGLPWKFEVNATMQKRKKKNSTDYNDNHKSAQQFCSYGKTMDE